MNIFAMIRRIRSLLLAPIDDLSGGGGVADTTGGSPADTGGAPAVDVPGDGGEPQPPAAPTTMLEAIERGLQQSQPNQPGQPRDQQGRFATKDPAQPQPQAAQQQPGQPAAQPQQQVQDDLQMPEGLGKAAQQRFQSLANEVKELRPLREQVEMLGRQQEYIRENFEQHKVQQEQFEQAMQVIGMMNSGDFKGALQFLQAQMQELAVLAGEVPGRVDPLSAYPDLRQSVDALEMTEARAMELARARRQQQLQTEYGQRQQQEQQAQQATQQAIQGGMKAVDEFCRQMAATDVDYPAIEAQLLPEIKNLVNGVPPSQWKAIVETNYRLIKRAASAARTSAPSGGGSVLRPTGNASPAQAPKSAFEAMWGKPQPA